MQIELALTVKLLIEYLSGHAPESVSSLTFQASFRYYLIDVHEFSVSRGVTVAMLVYRTIAKKVFREFDSIIMQNLSDILPSFCAPTWSSHHVSENQEYASF